MDKQQNPTAERRHRATLRWIVTIATAALVFDGYDLVVYGAVVTCFVPRQADERTEGRTALAPDLVPGGGASVLAHE
ncbi:hypothetical protein ACIF8T_35040 [Streptomyces sp. NPDC085946]|uniref:hypothetical protein n=1 Tax=Streptomyces sp. NPDC085946 TaxID=3365744 RepID=UPI0037D67F2C